MCGGGGVALESYLVKSVVLSWLWMWARWYEHLVWYNYWVGEGRSCWFTVFTVVFTHWREGWRVKSLSVDRRCRIWQQFYVTNRFAVKIQVSVWICICPLSSCSSSTSPVLNLTPTHLPNLNNFTWSAQLCESTELCLLYRWDPCTPLKQRWK